MRLFLDTANLEEIRTGASWGVISGVTTNPSLIAKKGADFKQTVLEICDILEGDISAEVLATRSEEMIKEGQKLADIHKNIVVKIPMMDEGLKATKELSAIGVRINTTLVFSPNQALLAALAGTYLVSPFIGRIDDVGGDGVQVLSDICDIYECHGFSAQVLSASIRHPLHVYQSAMVGAHAATLPFKVLEQMTRHPQSDAGLEKFLSDAKKGNVKI